MTVSAVGHSGTAAQAAASSTKSGTVAQAASSTSGTKKDSAIISQRAKDLAALKAGKSYQEEASESMMAKLQEANGH